MTPVNAKILTTEESTVGPSGNKTLSKQMLNQGPIYTPDMVSTRFVHVLGMLYTFGRRSKRPNMVSHFLCCEKSFEQALNFFLPTSMWAETLQHVQGK